MWLFGFLVLLGIVFYPKQSFVGTWGENITPLAGQVIVLDPGHGGPDGGAVGKEGTQEKDIALPIAERVREYLEQAGARVYVTREKDQDLAGKDTRGLAKRKSEDIRNRLAFIEEKRADFFVSIHLNALVARQWSGAQTFYTEGFPENKHLATSIQDEIIRNLENTDRAPLQIKGIYLLDKATVPGALVEVGFLSNEAELSLLKDENYQQKMAASIYQGILKYSE